MSQTTRSCHRGGFHLEGAAECRDRLVAVGIDAPEWGDVDWGQRPGFHPDGEFPTFSRTGWQSFASAQMEEVFFQNTVWPRLDPTEQALVRSQRGPMAGIPFHCSPVSPTSRFDPQCFRVLLLRRLRCPFPLSSAFCRCGQPLDPRGTTVQFARHRGCSDDEASFWRAALCGSVEKPAPGCLPTSVSRILTFFWSSC